jgi:hypothetical protein
MFAPGPMSRVCATPFFSVERGSAIRECGLLGQASGAKSEPTHARRMLRAGGVGAWQMKRGEGLSGGRSRAEQGASSTQHLQFGVLTMFRVPIMCDVTSPLRDIDRLSIRQFAARI